MTLLTDIWKSFLEMPLWVRIWTFLILVPVNFFSVWFIGQPESILIASLAVAGVAFNAIPLFVERGFSSTMAISHVVLWVPLVIILMIQLMGSNSDMSEDYRYFLIALLIINVISLAFDIPDVYKWFKDREKSLV